MSVMVTKDTGTFKFSHKGKTGILYVPSDLVKDSSFPLVEGKVVIEISRNALVVRKG